VSPPSGPPAAALLFPENKMSADAIQLADDGFRFGLAVLEAFLAKSKAKKEIKKKIMEDVDAAIKSRDGCALNAVVSRIRRM
jgi:hypothetical protein